ncbi:Nipped-B-like protein [Actinoplanes sp. SE50]|uniref:DUF5667 domain-containing protein n=1 Tax=unclassified Actinoplanes TaxID=2626549 RepID=UPI00023EDEA0|nr:MULTISPECIES: DUF5667 domain-containing protein [unclassified Actinoplanes]AEV88747.1 Nipped-B-like protein [Actinoplanes sp. SE50/110]ATO87153.1 Nipped-B-like protein [Actinoplanes sp. SE50]SLM04571.1 hypothetical protein ACSP50_7878 [Actinoplanes sp. SE50/110]
MKFPFPSSRSAERFAEQVDDPGGDHRHLRGHADDELTELLALSRRLSAARPAGQVDPEFRVGLRAMLVATAERDGIGRTAAEAEPEPATELPARGHRAIFGRRLRTRGAIVLGVAAGAMAVSGISAASENATPGDALYGVKRSTERAQLAIAGSDASRGQLSLDFARNRLREATTMTGDADSFRGVLDDMDADTRKGVKLITTSAVSRKDPAQLATLDTFVAAQRKVFEPAMQNLSSVNRERALTSLGLLQDVSQRTGQLREGLDCEKVVQTGADGLGPKLRDCGEDPSDKTPPGGTRAGGDRSTSKPNNTTTKPVVPGSSAQPGASTGVPGHRSGLTPSTPVNGRTTTSPTPAGTPTLDDGHESGDEGTLGGLLGNVF